MSFTFKPVGTFNTASEAENWCRQQNIAATDSRIVTISSGVELSIRDNVVDSDREDPRPFGF